MLQRKSIFRYESTSSDDDYNSVSSNINLLNPQIHQLKNHVQSCRIRSGRKLLKSKLPVDNSTALHCNSSVLEQKIVGNKNEVTFTEVKYSSGEGTGQGITRSKQKLRKRSGTPRIVQAIKNHSGTLSLKREEEYVTPRCQKEIKSKCNVIVLCNGDQSNQLDHQVSAKSSENCIRIAKSEQTIVTAPLPFNRPSTPPRISTTQSSKKKNKTQYLIESSLPFEKQIYYQSVKKYPPLNVDTVDELKKCQICRPDINNMNKKLMVQSNIPTQAQTHENVNEIKRMFPFQSTPSGYLKVIPNQVVFESKKVSVLVADPKHTKVNIKTDINKPKMEYDNMNFGEEYSNINQTLSELPAGVTSSAIDQLQAQQKLAQIGTKYVPRTQPHRIKHCHREMKQQPSDQQSTLHRLSSATEVPLSSLGFNTDVPINWENINLPKKTDLYSELAQRISNYKNADFIVRIGIDEFRCHLLVLQSYSIFFDKQNCKEIDLTSIVTSKAFSIIYDWMISSTSESCHLLRRDNILDIFVAAQYLGIKELEEQCWAFIDNDELFSEDTAFLLYLEAKKIGNTAVMELMIPRIMKFFLLLVSTKDFLELSVEELCLLLRSNYICVNSEIEVLMSAVRWLMFDWNDRKQYMLHVLKCIRFGLIPPWQLIDVKRNPENPEFMELMSYEEVRKMVDDGLAFVIIKCWYGDQTEDYYHWIDLLGLTEPTNRNWAGEDKNYVTYREFLLYLDDYQRAIMPELKLRRAKSMSSNHQQCSELPQSNRTYGNCINHCAIKTMSSAKVDGSINNPTIIPSKFLKTTIQSPQLSQVSASGVPSRAPPSAPMSMGMSPELFTKYLTSLGHNSKPNACGNGMDNDKVKIGNAAMCHNTWQNHKLDFPQGYCYDNNSNECTIIDNNIKYYHELEPNIIMRHDKYFYKKQFTPAHVGDYINLSKSEDNTKIKAQTTCHGYKTRTELDELKQITSGGNQSTEKNAELLLSSTINSKLLEPARTESINTQVYKSSFKNSERKYRPGSSYKKQFNSPMNQDNFNQNLNTNENFQNNCLDVEKFYHTSTQKDSKPCDKSIQKNTSINHLSVQRDKSTTLLYNFDGRMSSVTPSDDNTDSDEPLSPKIHQNTLNKHKTFYRPKSDAERQINIDTIEKSENFFPDYSLFYSEYEAVLVLGGIDLHLECGISDNTGRDMYRYKPIENIWEFVGEIPEPRHHHSTIYLNGRIYLVGGADPRDYELQKKTSVVGTVWSYDPTRRQWFNESEMLTPRKNFGLVVAQGKIFAIGGEDDRGMVLKSVEAFDPLECMWKKMQPMNLPRVGSACANFQDFIWVAGGMTKFDILNEVECYDPIKNIWHKIESLRIPRCFASLCVNNDSLYLIGGAGKMSSCDNMTESIKTIDVWDINLRTWCQLTEMSIARHNHSISYIGNQLLIIGGITTVYMKTLKCIERFCCKRTKWIEGVAQLPYAISGHDSVSLPPLNTLKHF